jgi:hypothetical protein
VDIKRNNYYICTIMAMMKKNKPAPAGMKELPATRRAVGSVIGKVAGKKAEYKYLAKKADYATPSGKLYKAVSETKPLPATRRAVGKVVGAVAGKKAEYKYLAKKADYVTAQGKFTKKK